VVETWATSGSAAHRVFELLRDPHRIGDRRPERCLEGHVELAAVEMRDEALGDERNQGQPARECDQGQSHDHDAVRESPAQRGAIPRIALA
jgi:hypothetical protein